LKGTSAAVTEVLGSRDTQCRTPCAGRRPGGVCADIPRLLL
jgi:hypothetical protein